MAWDPAFDRPAQPYEVKTLKRTRDLKSDFQWPRRVRAAVMGRVAPPRSGGAGGSRSRTASKYSRKRKSMSKSRTRKRTKSKKGHRKSLKSKIRNTVLFNMSPRSTFVTRGNGRLTASASAQVMDQLSDMFNYLDLADATVGMVAAFPLQIGSSKSVSFQVSRWSQFFMFHNQCNTHVRLTLYECASRYDSPAIAGMDPLTLMNDSFTDSKSSGSIGTLAATTYGATPYMAGRFTTLWKVTKRTVLEMVAGGQATYSFKSKRKATINLNRYKTTGGTALINGERGLYKILLYQIHGYPCNDVTTKTNIAISEAAIDFVRKEKVVVQWNMYNNYRQYAFMSAGTFGAATPTIMSEASGTAQTVVTA